MSLYKPENLSVTVPSAGTRVQLNSTKISSPAVILQAKTTNTGIIYVGGSSVAAGLGFELQAKDSVSLGDLELSGDDTDLDLSKWYIDASVSGEGVNVFYAKQE